MLGCTQHTTAKFESAPTLPTAKRKPDGIAVDLTSEPPEALDRGHTDDAILTLRAPLGPKLAFKKVRAYFDAVLREDINAVQAAVRPGALVYDTSSSASGRMHNLNYLWRQRFYKHEYQKLAQRLLYRESDVRTYRADSRDALPPHLAEIRGYGGDGPDALVLRVPIASPTLKNERLFGDEVVFWLDRQDDGYVITQIAEDIPF